MTLNLGIRFAEAFVERLQGQEKGLRDSVLLWLIEALRPISLGEILNGLFSLLDEKSNIPHLPSEIYLY